MSAFVWATLTVSLVVHQSSPIWSAAVGRTQEHCAFYQLFLWSYWVLLLLTPWYHRIMSRAPNNSVAIYHTGSVCCWCRILPTTPQLNNELIYISGNNNCPQACLAIFLIYVHVCTYVQIVCQLLQRSITVMCQSTVSGLKGKCYKNTLCLQNCVLQLISH